LIFWQVTADFAKFNYWDIIYISGFGGICDILGYHKFSKAWFFADYLNISVLLYYLVLWQEICNLETNNLTF